MIATAITAPDLAVFLIAGLMCVFGALGVVFNRNPVHSALSLVLTLFGVAVLFVEQSAHFLAAVQVIVYAGAVVVMFLFVIMLIGVDRAEKLGADGKWWKLVLSILVAIATFSEILLLGRSAWITGQGQTTSQTPRENIQDLARSVFDRYAIPFELTSLLLIIAVIGAVVLARRSEQFPIPGDRSKGQSI